MFTFPVVLAENEVTVIFFSANECLSVKSFIFHSQVTILRVVLQSASDNISNDTRMSVE